jgi:hypothetical protein
MDFGRVAGISTPTVSAAMAGRRLSPRTVRRIAAALAASPPVEGIDMLLVGWATREATIAG